MKWLVVVGMLVAPGLALASDAANYWLGYSETPAALGWTGLFGFGILELTGFLLVCVLCGICFAKPGRRLQAFLMMMAFWPLFFLSLRVLPSGGSMLVRGLHDRVMHDYTLDDLRRFAREVNVAGLLNGGFINHGDIHDLPKDQQAAFRRLQAEFSFMHWLNDNSNLTGPSLLNYGDQDEVDFEWGGALSGHWGCSIGPEGKRNDPPSDALLPVLHASDDIYFFYD